MKKILLLSLILIIFITELDAQRRNGRISRRQSSVGTVVASFGPSYCFGDAQDSPFDKSFINGTNADFSIGFRQKFANNLAYKTTLSYGNYTGTENSYLIRGFDFNSQIFNFSLRGEYGYGFSTKRFHIFKEHYVFGYVGSGILSTKSTHNFNSSRSVDVRVTDITAVIPYGFGYHYDLNNNFILGAEVSWQFPLSDYLDGIHPTPINASKSNDVLFGISFTVAYKIFE